MLMNIWQFHLPKWYRMGLVWAISASFIYTGLLTRAFPHLLALNLTYCSKSSLLLVFCFFFFNLITLFYVGIVQKLELTQICLNPWNSFNGKIDDILPLELFQGIIRNTERLKEKTLLLREGHKLEGKLICEGVLRPLFISWH